MSAVVTWNAGVVIASTTAKVLQGLDRGAQLVVDTTKQKLSRSQPTKTTKSGRRVGLDPSAPGEPPKRLEGRLLASITREAAHVEGTHAVARVGTNVAYARRLEQGFVGTDSAGRNISQAPRPYLRPSLAEKRDAIKAAIGGQG